jgi:glycosyltransferase involved in cell wall biosynthesis
VIPNGIAIPQNTEPLKDFPIRRQFQIDPAAPMISVVCRLDRHKGLEFFLRAAVAVAQQIPAARFLIVGDSKVEPAYKVELQQYATNIGLGDRVRFTGMRHDVPDVLREATLAVVPSLNESFSNSLLEAMAAGLPVVATNVGGNPEVAEDGRTALLVPARDPASLSRAMLEIIQSPGLAQRLGQAGRERVAQHFSIDSVLRQTENLYVNLLESKGLLRTEVPIQSAAQA